MEIVIKNMYHYILELNVVYQLSLWRYPCEISLSTSPCLT
jgi:hypothetical protein